MQLIIFNLFLHSIKQFCSLKTQMQIKKIIDKTYQKKCKNYNNTWPSNSQSHHTDEPEMNK